MSTDRSHAFTVVYKSYPIFNKKVVKTTFKRTNSST